MLNRQTFSKTLSNVTIMLTMLAVLTACGFHLRGNLPLPESLQNIFLSSPKGTFANTLTELIENAGSTVLSSKSGANAILTIKKIDLTRDVGTLDERGKVNSYNLKLKVGYVLEDPEGNEIRSAKVSENRRYNFNPELVVESESEENELREDMEQAAALKIMRQLSTISSF